MTKSEILEKLLLMKENNFEASSQSEEGISVENYISFVRNDKNGRKIWTEAFQMALYENKHIRIPESAEPYYIDKTIKIPSNRYIEASKGAVVRLIEGVKTLLVRNENNENGTYTRETFANPDTNIVISGGRWEESRDTKGGYGASGMYDDERSYYGVSTCMFFNNVKNLTLENLTISNAGGFSIQMGNVKNVVVENIEFKNCFADGVHINGNTENIYINNVKGQVGDDLVALNMYDWQDSSVDFGPIKTVWCENLELSSDSRYKALRILPGVYFYKDGSTVDCSLNDAVIKGVRGIKNFKLYFQSPAYNIGESREAGDTGTGNNIYFEDIDITLDEPIDKLTDYIESNPITGSIAAFEVGANIENLYFENINVTLYKDKYPMSFFLCVGPKSVRAGNIELFDPEINSSVKNLYLKNVSVNGSDTQNAKEYVHEIAFDDVYGDGLATGKGFIENINVLTEDK